MVELHGRSLPWRRAGCISVSPDPGHRLDPCGNPERRLRVSRGAIAALPMQTVEMRSVSALLAVLGLVILAGAATANAAGTSYPVYAHAQVLGVVEHANGEVALTFDDCSNASAWRAILITLRRDNVHAAFFCIGEEVQSHPRLARRVVANGNMLCNHTWSHADLTASSTAGITSQIRRTRGVLNQVAQSRCRFFRPPYGSYNREVLRIAGKLGYRWAALWSVDPQDWQEPGTSAIVERVISHTHSGSIVLLHCLPETAAAVPKIIRSLRRHHLRPMKLSTVVRRGRPTSGGWPSYSQL